MRILFVVLFVSLLSASAQAEGEAQACVSIKDDDARLECYDLALGTKKKVDTPAYKSAWQKSVEKSKIDDSTSVFLSTGNTELVMNEYGQTQNLRLRVRCMENVTAVHIGFDGLFMSDLYDAGTVTFRVDNEPAFSRDMAVSTNNRALGLWSGGRSIPFLKKVMHGEKLIVRARPHSGSHFTTSFNIKGLDKELAPLREACGW